MKPGIKEHMLYYFMYIEFQKFKTKVKENVSVFTY